MKTFDKLIDCLYESHEEADILDGIFNLAEQIKTENRIEIKKGPLKTALKELDVDIDDTDLRPDYGSVLAHFDSSQVYQDAVNKLETPAGMEKLAELGWVMNICGDNDPNEPNYRIRFLAIDLHDGPPDDSTKPTSNDDMMRKVADEFSFDPENPMNDDKNRGTKAGKVKESLTECVDEVKKLRYLDTPDIVRKMAKKGVSVTGQKVDSILGRK